MKGTYALARKFCLFALVFLSVMSLSWTAAAASLTFYEGNGCKQDVVCEFRSTSLTDVNLKEYQCSNDEARSLKLDAGVAANTRVEVFDDPHAAKDDDWAVISVNPSKSLDKSVCVSSFESDAKYDDLVKVDVSYDNGLDGKVSHITITPGEDW